MSVNSNDVDIPSLLPSVWFSDFPEGVIDGLVDATVVEVSDIFFDKLSSVSPSSVEFQVASSAARSKLIEVIESSRWIETICGESATSDQRGYLRLHLRKLITPPEIPDLSYQQAEVRPIVLSAVTAIFTVIGLNFGGVFSKLVGISGEAGLLFGSVVGAVIGVSSVMFLATHKKLRKILLAGLGITAVTDIALFYFCGNILSWLRRGSVLFFLKRFGSYCGLALLVLLSKHEKVFDRDNYRKEVEAIIAQWLRSVLAVFAVLTYKINSLEKNPFNKYAEDKDKLNTIVSIVKKLKNSDSDDMEIIISELVQELESGGFDLGGGIGVENFCNDNSNSETDQKNIWDDSQNKLYNQIGIIRNGDNFQIVEEPIISNKIVEKKGLARKKQ
jgi:hypothetical protein